MICYYCATKAQCPSYVQPGSVYCIANQMRTGYTHAGDPRPVERSGSYCRFCGHPLKTIGQERFCNNPSCWHHYEPQ